MTTSTEPLLRHLQQLVFPPSADPIWDVVTGAKVQHLAGIETFLDSVRFSSDGRMLASSGSDRSVRLWKIATGEERQRFNGLRGADHLRPPRTVEVLEHLDTAESRRLLAALAGGAPEARLTSEAKALLTSLATKP